MATSSEMMSDVPPEFNMDMLSGAYAVPSELDRNVCGRLVFVGYS
jgi:hypothetical protein